MPQTTRVHGPKTHPHVRLTSALLYDAGVSDRAVRLWAILDDVCRTEQVAALRVTALATLLGCGRDSVKRARAELVAGGWLLVDTSGGRGRPALWAPLQRSRAVDNPVERGAELRCFLGVKESKPAPLTSDALRGTARAKKEEAGCARCDHGWLWITGDQVARCACSRPPSPF